MTDVEAAAAAAGFLAVWSVASPTVGDAASLRTVSDCWSSSYVSELALRCSYVGE